MASGRRRPARAHGDRGRSRGRVLAVDGLGDWPRASLGEDRLCMLLRSQRLWPAQRTDPRLGGVRPAGPGHRDRPLPRRTRGRRPCPPPEGRVVSGRDARASPAGDRGAPALSVDRLSKRFGDRAAFDDVSFEVAHGEVFGFLGPNGAGKTTMVRTLGTLLTPSAGAASVAGIPLPPDTDVAIRRRIAIMPEAPGLYLRLSVLDNLECFADLYEVPDPSDRI